MSDKWNDNAIEDLSEDLLERGPFVDRVVEQLLDPANKRSRVIGVSGPWGSGKTSIANMVKTRLRDKAQVVHYEPWAVTNHQALLEEFLHTIITSLVESDKAIAKGLRKKLYKYASRSLGAISVISSQVPDPEGKLKLVAALTAILKSRLDDWTKEKQKTLSELRDEIVAELSKHTSNKKPLIVVVDNLDRLDQNEVRDVFRTIRAVTDFPGLRFLLLYDEQQVLHGLNEVVLDSRGFLEKIIDVPFEIPMVSSQIRERLVVDALADIQCLRSNFENDWEGKWKHMIECILLPGLKTVRSIKRFKRAVESTAVGASFEGRLLVNPIDFVVIQFIRLELPETYAQLRETLQPKAGGARGISIRTYLKEKAHGKSNSNWYTELYAKMEEGEERHIIEEAFDQLGLKILENQPRQDYLHGRFRSPYWMQTFLNHDRYAARVREEDLIELNHLLETHVDVSAFLDRIQMNDPEMTILWVLANKYWERSDKMRAALLASLVLWGEQDVPVVQNIDYNALQRPELVERFLYALFGMMIPKDPRWYSLIKDLGATPSWFLVPKVVIENAVYYRDHPHLVDKNVQYGLDSLCDNLREVMNREWQVRDPWAMSNYSYWRYVGGATSGEGEIGKLKSAAMEDRSKKLRYLERYCANWGPNTRFEFTEFEEALIKMGPEGLPPLAKEGYTYLKMSYDNRDRFRSTY